MNNKIYLAGKITKNNWRNRVLNTSRIDELNVPYIIENKFKYTGPYFLSCDHGCFHGEKTHGRRIEDECCCSDVYINESRQTTISKCYKWIDDADIVFCWIDDITAYGTFTEIGYATAKNKIIYIACDKKIEKESLDIWFPLLSSDVLIYESDIESAWHNFIKWYDNGMHKSFHNLYKEVSTSQYRLIKRLLDKSKYMLVDKSIDLSKISAETAGKIIAVLKNKNKTIEDYNLSNILKIDESLKSKDAFSYIEKPSVIKTQISTFLKKNINFKNEDNSLLDISFINNIDRGEIAKKFVEKIIDEKSYSFISGENNLDLFTEDVTKRIDAIIPRQYYVEYMLQLYPEFPNAFITENFLGKNSYEFTKDLVYKYEENNKELIFKPELIDNRFNIYIEHERAKSIITRNLIKKEQKKLNKMTPEERFKYRRKIREQNNEKVPPTIPQLNYLKSLVERNGYSLKNEIELDMDTTSDLIDALKNRTEISIELTNMFLELID